MRQTSGTISRALLILGFCLITFTNIGHMTEKQKILEKIMPLAILKAITPAAEQAVAQTVLLEGIVPLRTFPFRVGRESRVKMIDGKVERIERVKHGAQHGSFVPNNELYLVDEGHLLNISREHFQIERDGEKFYLHDRNSACGTLVEDRAVGGDNEEDTVELQDGDTITVGTRQSPYIFQFIVVTGFEIRPVG